MVTDEKQVSDAKHEHARQHAATQSNAQSKPAAKPATEANNVTSKDAAEDQVAKLTADLISIQEKLDTAEQNAAKHWDALLRAKAEHDNTRKRLERDVENAHKFALERFAQDLLPVIDSLEMGINAANDVETDILKLREGSVLTLKMFTDCANKFGIEAIDPKGQPFNPEFHQAMSIQESAEYPPNTVIAVMQKGYTLNGRLVRPAMVLVSKAVENQTTAPNQAPTQPK